MMLYQETLKPDKDVQVIVEQYRTGQFNPKPILYENYFSGTAKGKTTTATALTWNCVNFNSLCVYRSTIWCSFGGNHKSTINFGSTVGVSRTICH